MSGYALPSESEERVVVESVRAGDDAALQLLYSKYAPALRDFCRGRLADPTEAEDACHETMLKARKAFGRFKPGARVWPWLATIAANVCINIHLAHARSAHLNASTDPLLGEEPEEEVARRAHIQIVIDSLRALPQDYRSYIYLRDYDGWSYEQIARFYETSVTSVRSLLFRARQSLKEEIKRTAKSRGRWPLSVFVPRLWMRLRSTAQARKHSVTEAVSGAYRSGLSGAIESISALGPTLSNATVAVVVALFVASGGSSAVASSPAPHLVPATAFADVPAATQETGGSTVVVTPASRPPAPSEAPADLPPATPATKAEELTESQPNAPINVTFGIEPQSPSEDANTVSSPSTSASADTDADNSDGEHAWLDVPSYEAGCPPPENQGTVTGVICPVLEQQLG